LAFEGSKTLTEQVVNYLSYRIIRAQLAPGARIREIDLAAELGVSRTPIREAFRILEKNRLIEVLPHRGASVTDLSPSIVGWILDIIEGLGVILVRKAAEAPNEKNIRNLRNVMNSLIHNAEIGDSNAYYLGMLDFIAALLRINKNAILDDLIKDIMPSVRRAFFATISGRSESLDHNSRLAEHIVTAIEANDVQGADGAIRIYLQNERAFALKVFGEKNHSLN